jgi:hypothetical protein
MTRVGLQGKSKKKKKNTATYTDQQELMSEIIYISSTGYNKHAYSQWKRLW